MASRPVDADIRQLIRDFYFTPNGYRLVDKYVIRDGKRHPFAVICPGGGYQVVCSFIEGVPFAKRLNALGISAFIVYYRVRKKALYPAPQEDLARAVREIFANADKYCLETDNYSVWGSSAGGHLAASFGLDYAERGLPKPGVEVLIYPVISMEKALTHRGSHDNLLGKDASPEMEFQASIDRQVTADYPPTYIWCGDADETVPPENTKRMAAALKEAGVPVQCEIFPGIGHGVGPATGTVAEGWIRHAVDFWRGQQTAALNGNAPEYDPGRIAADKSSSLYGRHIIFLGSSVTFGATSQGVSFADYIAARNGCSFTKEAVSGTTLVDNGPRSYISRLNRLEADRADLFVCQLSTNDATKNMPLGTVSEGNERADFDTSTVAGAIEYIIASARERWNCPVVFYTNAKYNSAAYGAMVKLLYQIAEKWKIDVIDMWNDEAFNSITAKERALYMSDPIHPTKAGYLQWWTPFMEEKLCRIITGKQPD